MTIAGFSRLGASLAVLAGLLLAGGLAPAGATAAPGGQVDAKCLKCHGEYKDRPNVVGGEFQSLSGKAHSLQVEVGDEHIIVKFTPETKVENVPNLKALQKPIPVMVEFEQKGADRVAILVKAKPVIKVAEDKQVSLERMKDLVAKGPAQGKFTLVDSRPPAAFQEGHIPGAVNVPFGNMPNLMDKLPQDKASLLIFYCGGFR